MDMNKAVAYIQIQIQIRYNLEEQQYALQVVTAHTVGKTQTFAICTIIRDGS